MHEQVYVWKTFNVCKTFAQEFYLFASRTVAFSKKKTPIKGSIYKIYHIEQIFCYQVWTETDSTSIEFILVSDLASSYPECEVRDILLAIFSKTEIRERFDKSDEFWGHFNVQTAQESTF